MRAQSSAATAARSCGAHSLAGGVGAKILRRTAFAGTAGLRLALRRPWQMRLKPLLYSSNPRLQPLRISLQLRQHLRRRMCARRQRKSKIHKRKIYRRKIHKRETNCAACSFARGAAAKILRLIDSADTVGLLGTLRRPWQMRHYNRHLQPLRLRRPLCQYLRRRNLRLRLYLRQYLRRRKPRLPPRRRMQTRRLRWRKVRRRKMYGRKFCWRKPNCAAFWRGFAARLRRFPTGL